MIQNFTPISNEQNTLYVSNLTQKDLLNFNQSKHAIQITFQLPVLYKTTFPTNRNNTHLFDYDMYTQSIITMVQQKLNHPNITNTCTRMEKLNSNLKLLLLTGINNFPEENPLSNLNNSILVIEVLHHK